MRQVSFELADEASKAKTILDKVARKALEENGGGS